MKTLPAEIWKNGFKYKLIIQNDNQGLYAQYYETFLIGYKFYKIINGRGDTTIY